VIASRGLLGSPLPRLTRRWRDRRLVRSGAYRLGEFLGNRHRVVIGQLPGGSPIALALEDHQHRSIYFYGEYEPDLTSLFSEIVRPGTVIYDVGANAGYFSLTGRDLGGQVHAFEPNPALWRLLERSLSLRPGGVTVNRAACSDQVGTTTLHLNESSNTGMSTVSPTDGSSLGRPSGLSVDVPMLTLDDYSASTGSTPDVIKVDVEGHEREVLSGAERVIRENRPTVIVETGHPEVMATMSTWGYTAHRVREDGSLGSHNGVLDLDSGGFENVCFLPPGA
jgi:FkbM family methyltransferase